MSSQSQSVITPAILGIWILDHAPNPKCQLHLQHCAGQLPHLTITAHLNIQDSSSIYSNCSLPPCKWLLNPTKYFISGTLSGSFTPLCRSSLTHPILPFLSCSLASPTHTPALYAAGHCGTGVLEACLARQGSVFSVDYEISDECSALKTCQG
jgi:hypothetical protein